MHLRVAHDERLFRNPAPAKSRKPNDQTTAPGEKRRPAVVNE